jgi:hypothetical protein
MQQPTDTTDPLTDVSLYEATPHARQELAISHIPINHIAVGTVFTSFEK